ncbi:uncharacterized protein LOC115879398 isoform X1 [Sitophilus oryzae]|uniref:Uncharacterized protein LOC115879398 isoform X1 n=1 Tax=Sitophilus oryzae TaxID=7048 RepID=A0A6J2XKP3_SITOR|nr:uncharacterized protein LOC115879398 isoform X1 [Sitophilus oryzae]
MLVKLSLAILCFMAASCHALTYYNLPFFDFTEPSCKLIVAELIKIDSEYIGASAIFPQALAFMKKYDPAVIPRRHKRQLGLLYKVVGGKGVSLMVSIMEHAKTTRMFQHIAAIFHELPQCLYWLQGYRLYLKNNVISKIFYEQIEEFFS